MLISPVIFALSGLLMGVLNAQQHFALPALAPACYRLGQILGLVFLVPRWGILGLAWGVVLGSALHLLIQLPALARFPLRYQLTLGLRDASTRLVGALMLPRLVGVGVVQLNFLVNTILASGMPEGSLAAITLAFALMIMPQAVLAQSRRHRRVADILRPGGARRARRVPHSDRRHAARCRLRRSAGQPGPDHAPRASRRVAPRARRVHRRVNADGGLGAVVVRRRAGRALAAGDRGARFLRAAGHAHTGGGRRGGDGLERRPRVSSWRGLSHNGDGCRTAAWRSPIRSRRPSNASSCWPSSADGREGWRERGCGPACWPRSAPRSPWGSCLWVWLLLTQGLIALDPRRRRRSAGRSCLPGRQPGCSRAPEAQQLLLAGRRLWASRASAAR